MPTDRPLAKNELYVRGYPNGKQVRHDVCSKAAFTLAETLITLVAIGVVAALTIPSLMQHINEYTLSKQRNVFERKFEEGLKQMRVDGKLEEKYDSTEAFVSEMQNYFKIAQVCDKDNLTNCFSEKFTYDENVTYQIIYGQKDEKGNKQFVEDTEAVKLDFATQNLKTNSAISTITKVNAKYDSDVVGIVFSDGVQMLLTYNPDCTGIESGDTQGNTKKCFGYFADVNSIKSPNLITKDIITNIQLEDLGFEISSNGLFFSYRKQNGPYNCMSPAEETAEIIQKYNLGTVTTRNRDCWASATIYCQDLQEDGGNWHLPNKKQLQTIAKLIYTNADCQISSFNGQPRYQSCKSDKVTSSYLWQQLRNNGSYFLVWGDTSQSTNYASIFYYNTTYGVYTPGSDWSYGLREYYSGIAALCVR